MEGQTFTFGRLIIHNHVFVSLKSEVLKPTKQRTSQTNKQTNKKTEKKKQKNQQPV